MNKILEFLSQNNIEYIKHDHPPVYTCEEAEKHCSHIKGISCKNLLLTDKKDKRYFLLILPAQKQTDLKKFTQMVNEKKVTFAKKEKVKEILDLEPGSVSPFGLINDKENVIELFIDREVYDADAVSFHPNVNTATVEISKDMFHKYLNLIDHKVNVIDL